jgi:hypothetical protein
MQPDARRVREPQRVIRLGGLEQCTVCSQGQGCLSNVYRTVRPF